jgi:hypothetical protein
MQMANEDDSPLGFIGRVMMQAASTPETSVDFYQTIRRYEQEDSHLHAHLHKNLKILQKPTG